MEIESRKLIFDGLYILIMKILISGIEGYLGSVMSGVLQERGHTLKGIDTGFFRESLLISPVYQPPVIHTDTRNVSVSQLQGYDAVIHLADLSNDPLGMIDEKVTREINYTGAVDFARKAKKAGVKRYIFGSSCSIYGTQSEELANEESETNPQTMYAQCKLDVEKELLKLADTSFTPVILRCATIYGVSPRMRFDLVINKLVGDAYLYNKISLDNGGKQWRPVVHILDVSQAFACAVEAPKNKVHKEIFNVGSRNGNYLVSDFGAMIKEEFPNCVIRVNASNNDTRSYKVSFEKIHRLLPGFSSRHDVRSGIMELHKKYKEIGLTKDLFNSYHFTRLKQIQHLLKSQKIDDSFHWKLTDKK